MAKLIMLLCLAALQSLSAVTVCDTPEDTTKVITTKAFLARSKCTEKLSD